MTAGQTLATLDAAGILDARNGLLAAQAALGEAQASEAVGALQVRRGLEQLKFGVSRRPRSSGGRSISPKRRRR